MERVAEVSSNQSDKTMTTPMTSETMMTTTVTMMMTTTVMMTMIFFVFDRNTPSCDGKISSMKGLTTLAAGF